MHFCPQGGARQELEEIKSEGGQNFVYAHGAGQPTFFSAETCEEKTHGVASPPVILELSNSEGQQSPTKRVGGGHAPLE